MRSGRSTQSSHFGSRQGHHRRYFDEEDQPLAERLAKLREEKKEEREEEEEEEIKPKRTPATLQQIFRDNFQIWSRLKVHRNLQSKKSSKRSKEGPVEITAIERVQLGKQWTNFEDKAAAEKQLPLVEKAAIPQGQTAQRLGGLSKSWEKPT